jgi:hypothetical protein
MTASLPGARAGPAAWSARRGGGVEPDGGVTATAYAVSTAEALAPVGLVGRRRPRRSPRRALRAAVAGRCHVRRA